MDDDSDDEDFGEADAFVSADKVILPLVICK